MLPVLLLVLTWALGCFANTLQSRIEQVVPRALWGPPLSARHRDVVEQSGCNPFRAESFGMAVDRHCVRYITDRRNWRSVTPMLFSNKDNGLKFHNQFLVALRPPGLLAILKPPKARHSGLEPYNEYTAYQLDRLLRLNYVPPMGWVDVPFAVLRQAVHHDPAVPHMVFKNISVGERLETFLINWTRTHGYARTRVDGQEGVRALLILWMHGLQRLDRTALRFPQSETKSHLWWRLFHPRLSRNATITPKLAISLDHHSDMFVFDHLCNNPDRDLDNNIFALEGCMPTCSNDSWPHPGPPEYVHLDHGRAFHPTMVRWLPENPFHGFPRERARLCRFRRPLIHRLRQLNATGGLVAQLRRLLPHRVASALPSLRLADKRAREVLNRADKCIARYGEAAILQD
eukprot:EG_transcript_15031